MRRAPLRVLSDRGSGARPRPVHARQKRWSTLLLTWWVDRADDLGDLWAVVQVLHQLGPHGLGPARSPTRNTVLDDQARRHVQSEPRPSLELLLELAGAPLRRADVELDARLIKQ